MFKVIYNRLYRLCKEKIAPNLFGFRNNIKAVLILNGHLENYTATCYSTDTLKTFSEKHNASTLKAHE